MKSLFRHTIKGEALRTTLMAAMLLVGVTTMAQVTVGGNVYGGGNDAYVGGSAAVTINQSGAVVAGDIYGGGAKANVNSSDGTSATVGAITSVTLTNGTVRDVYGGGHGDLASLGGDHTDKEANVFGAVTVTVNGGSAQNVYGCNNLKGAPQTSVQVNISAGEVANDVYGGGNLASTAVGPVVNVSGGTVGLDVYGGGALADTGGSTVNITGGNVTRNIYGGGLGDLEDLGDGHSDVPALVNGAVQVNIGATDGEETPTYTGEATIGGSVYGCNNINGTPTGDVQVNIYKTHTEGKNVASYTESDAIYSIANVFGGGNKASYAPSDDANVATVHVYGCNNTIEDLFGGGDAAAAQGVVTVIDGGRMGRVFGGGNGEVTAANIGNGGIDLTVHGGVIGQLFAGSNERGTVSGTMNVEVDHKGSCSEDIAEFFCGSNKADLTGNLITTIKCGAGTFGDLYGGCNLANITGNVTLNIYGGTFDNVYGGSKGRAAATGIEAKAADITGNVTLNLYGGTIVNAFGGSNVNGNITGVITVNMLDLGGSCGLSVNNIYGASNQTAYTPSDLSGGGKPVSPIVNLINGTVSKKTDNTGGNVFGGAYGSGATVTANPIVRIGYDATTMSSFLPDPATLPSGYSLPTTYKTVVGGDVYGGGDAAAVTGTTTVTYNDTHDSSTVGRLFGGGNAAGVSSTTTVTLTNGKVTGGVYGGCNSSGSVGAVTIDLNGGTVGTDETHRADVYGGGYGSETTTTGAIDVTLNGTTVYGDLYGGSALGNVNASTDNTTTLTIDSNTLWGTIYGGGKGDVEGEEGHSNQTATSYGNVQIDYNTENEHLTGIFGGANINGLVKGGIEVNVLENVGSAGTAIDIFGGGYGKDTDTEGDVTVNIGTEDGTKTPAIYGDIYGGSALGDVNASSSNTTKVNFLNGALKKTTSDFGGNIYGGGLGDGENAAKVNGKVEVNISNTTQTAAQCKIDLRGVNIYGCNNTNGSPQDDVTVNIYKTAYNYDDYTTGDIYKATYSPDDGDPAPAYAINQVFGGGNLANYAPEDGAEDSEKKAKVYIYGCDNTINRVFSGGNAAAATGVETTIAGGRFDYVFGGGNGEGAAANIGAGGTNLTVNSGIINHLFGGGNVDGTITGPMLVAVNNTGCSEHIGEFFAGGNLAPIGDASHSVTLNTTIACGTVFDAVYGGSNLADIYGNITLTVNGGTIGEVYAGSKGRAASTGVEAKPANITGNTTLNIYGGAIGNAFGGSNINGDVTGLMKVNLDWSQSDCAQKSLDYVYGGGNQTTASGTTQVNLINGTVSQKVFGGGNAAGVGDATVNVNGGIISKGLYGGCNTSGTVSGDITVNVKSNVGASGSGNSVDIFGGGYGESTSTGGDVKVYIGDAAGTSTPTIYGDIYGGSAFGTVNDAIADITSVNILSGTVHGNIYGGGLGEEGEANVTKGQVNGTVIVNVGATDGEASPTYSGSALIDGDVYGCNNTNGSPKGNVTVNIYKTYNVGTYQATYTESDATYAIDEVFGGGNNADYSPTSTDSRATVHVYTCNNTIRRVFGGGNAAAAVGVVTTIDGGRIDKVFGGGNGEVTAANIGAGGTNLTVHGGKIAQLFGGSNKNGNITGAMGINIDNEGSCASDMYIAEFFCGNNEAPVNTNITAKIGCGTRFGDVYGGCNLADVTGSINLTVEGGRMKNVYGGSKGSDAKAADISGDVTLNIYGGYIEENAFGGSNVNGNIAGSITVNMDWSQASGDCNDEGDLYVGNVYGASNLATYTPTDATGSYPEVNIKHGTVSGSVFGGGKGDPDNAAKGVVTSNPVVTIGDNTAAHCAIVTGNVYGGGDAAAVDGSTSVTYNDNNANSTVANLFGGGNAAGVSGTSTVALTSGKVTTAVYGGCNSSGTIAGTSTVTVTGGTIGTAISDDTTPEAMRNVLFGGGKGSETSVTGNTTLNVGTKSGSTYTGNANIYGNVYGGSENGEVAAVNVNLYANTIQGNVFGGGYETADGKTAATNVTVVLEGTAFDGTYAGTAQVFGANNKKGTPTGHALVHVLKTTPVSGQTYDVAAVYGGGNNADYVPTDAKLSTEVIVEGCSVTSIADVYGGGNAAAVPATEVWILGSKTIDNVYGGGNGILGADHAAHVGFHRDSATDKSDYTTGSGKTDVKLVAGNVNNVYGGSNSNGDIREQANVSMPKLSDYTTTHEGATATNTDCCTSLTAQNIYGGGNAANMEGDVNIILECMPNDYVDAVYGGAANAIINGDVSLTVTSGKFGRVFGGNNAGGSINGTIKVVAKEEGCKPLEIGELYGGGNEAPYSIYGCTYNEGTQKWSANTSGTDNTEGATYAIDVLVESCTSIGKVFGGGNLAEVIGDTHVEINMFRGTTDDAPTTLRNLGKIGQVFGGGNLAKVTGSTTVDVGTDGETKVEGVVPEGQKKGVNIISGTNLYLDPEQNARMANLTAGIYGGGNLADVDGDATLNIGTAEQSLGINIAGNIFGGGYGNTTKVTGDVTVNIGKKTGNDTDGYTYAGFANITGDVYGGSAMGTVNSVNGTSLNAGKTTKVNLYGGTIAGDVYGGGLGDATYAANVWGPVTVTVKDGSVKDVFGGNNTNGTPKTSVAVNIDGGEISQSVYGGGNLAITEVSPVVTVTNGTIGTGIASLPAGQTAGAIYGNVYGGGKGSDGTGMTTINAVKAGLITGDTKVIISGGEIKHNVYGGGAYGSVGTFVYNESTGKITDYTSGGKAEIYITGGTIGKDGKENGMIFGSSRGDVGAVDAIHDRLAWVYDTHVAIGDTIATPTTTTTPLIRGSVYGGGENGHNYHSSYVRINGGTIGIASGDDVVSGTKTYKAFNYPYRGNVYGGGCGTDMYDSNNDDVEDAYNPLAGIVRGDATIRITAGQVVHNVYGAGAMGSVGTSDDEGGKTTINISGGKIGVDRTDASITYENGDVFGAARGDKDATGADLAVVRETEVTISEDGDVKGSVYGGGEVGNVKENTKVDMSGGTVNGSVFGGGKGVANEFACSKAMVGLVDQGVTKTGEDPNATYTLLDGGTTVTISNGTVNGDVYGGGEIGRVERNTIVTIGTAGNTTLTPIVKGHVFGAGKGLETHGYSALVRGNSTVTIQGKAEVWQNVHGGGEKASVGRYYVASSPADAETYHVRIGMPCYLKAGGKCTVNIQDDATIGKEANTGDVYGAGQGVEPSYTYTEYTSTNPYATRITNSKRMMAYTSSSIHPDDKRYKEWDYYVDENGNEDTRYVWEYFKTNADYLLYVETLGRASETDVVIGGKRETTGTSITTSSTAPTVKGSVYGGSESGFVYYNTVVNIPKGTVEGDAFGGGKGLLAYAEAGRVRRNTNLTVSGSGVVEGNVYGGGSLGDVGTIDKTDQTDYNYTWKQIDGATGNAHNNNTITGTNNNTGICNVTISGGTIGVATTSEPTKHGNVFGAGRGSSTTWWCEKAIAYATNVSVTKGTVYGNVYGGGEVGRLEDDAKVTIGSENDLTITGSVFGAGAGLATHGYSALVRGNAKVTVQGIAQVGGSVYGGGEIASVGRFHVVGGLPRNPQAGGTCTVKIQGSAKIGTSGTGHNVFGACKGVTPAYVASGENRSKSMQLRTNAEKYKSWSNYNDDPSSPFIWAYYETEADYLDFLKTLALTSNTHVTIDGSSEVYGSVYGGGERGVTLGGVDVNMDSGTVYEDVYGGGSLADSNTAMWDATNKTLHDYAELELIPGLSVVTGYYTDKSPESLITEEDAKATGTKYYAIYKTSVNLNGGVINGYAYGGGLGEGQGATGTPAYVYGDVKVELNKGVTTANAASTKGCIVSKVFGCNNLNGTPKGKVQVYVHATQNKAASYVSTNKTFATVEGKKTATALHDGFEAEGAETTYDVAAVYGGGNLSPYEPVAEDAQTEVYINGCELISIKQVYGGGNAAPAPATYVLVDGVYEIEELFGGGNGKDDYVYNNETYLNPGANVGYKNYTHPVWNATKNKYEAVDNTDPACSTKENRQANYAYGSGVAHLVVYGGTIHAAYGGSNEKGNIRYQAISKYEEVGNCDLNVLETYGGGKNSLIDGEIVLDLGCTTYMPEIFGGSKNADVNSDIVLNVTNGTYKNVFGGNNTSGNINGSITVNIKEEGCSPINIGNLYLGGYLAGYSVYGYDKTTNKPRTKEDYEKLTDAEKTAEGLKTPRKDPRINVISASKIDSIFGGGYKAVVVGNPHINVNMEEGRILASYVGNYNTASKPFVGEHNDAYDGYNIIYKGKEIEEETGDGILEIGTIGNIYGGGNLADIQGNTYVEIGTGKWVKLNDAGTAEVEETLTRNAATITGNVFGGGKGVANSFKCLSAMVGEVDKDYGSTNVIIGNGTVEGTVYGGGEIGRVEKNTNVTIGLDKNEVPEGEKSEPVIEGNVFGAGKGLSTHGYSALVRGNSTVTIQSDAKVKQSVYGGGEIASVGKYSLNAAGMPVSLANQNSGYCTVTVKDNAEIGPDDPMTMITTSGYPDDAGHVFGAGMGVLPYENVTGGINGEPWRMKPGDIKQTFVTGKYEYEEGKENPNPKIAYLRYMETLALATQTYVTISDNALVKGSVYGGSMNGHVQHDTNVTIAGGQIGCSKNTAARLSDDVWKDTYEVSEGTDLECASWDFKAPYAPFDIYDLENSKPKPATDGHTFYGNVFGGGSGYYPYAQDPDWQVVKEELGNKSRKQLGYADGLWHRDAGSVGGNTVVNITGGHILSSVYGGNEQTDVGTYVKDSNGDNSITIDPEAGNVGKCTINMTGGTVGVPRTVKQIQNHPVICNVFGAGKGDQRINFNTWTNVRETEVNISGKARIYGSTFGGGEDGHIIEDAKTNIGKSGEDNSKILIGTTGTSYMDGNVFGGGRGFSGDAQTAGTVGGNIEVNIEGGAMLGSVYGGGRLASVGTQFTAPDSPNYGNFIEDTNERTYGHVTVNISGGKIGNFGIKAYEGDGAEYSGNVFGGSMGRLTLLNGDTISIWPKMAQVKNTSVSIYGEAEIKRNVFGGGELGTVRDNASVTVGGRLNVVNGDSTIVTTGAVAGYPIIYHDVFGGGFGSDNFKTKTIIHVKEPIVEKPDPTNHAHYKTVDYKFTPMIFAGCVGKNTFVNIAGGQVRKSVYGGGEMASVGIIDCRIDADGEYINFHKHDNADNGFALSWPYHFENIEGFEGATHVKVTGGRLGLKNGEEEDGFDDNGDVYGAGKGIAGDYKDYVYCANVGSTDVVINYPENEIAIPKNYLTTDFDCVAGAAYGGGENGHVMGNTKLTLVNGLIGHSIYGGGSGKGKFTKWLKKIPEARRTVIKNTGTGTAPNTNANDEYETECYSITAGKVFGNTEIEMTGGYVVRNIYGGGNMGSVGKGNYAGGLDDYSKAGYGETLNGNLWDGVSQFSQAFLNSGKCTVKITGGTVGYIEDDPTNPLKYVYPRDTNTGLPYGNVFGGCRGEAAPNILESPRYLYCPEFFLGYVNATDVTIGKADGTGPTIISSVYGGGMDGHVRRDTKVTINGGEIGSEYTTEECTTVGTSDRNHMMWLQRGNVYGAGSGIGKYKFDLNYDGDFGDSIAYTTPPTATSSGRTTKLKEEDHSTSAGSVTRFTEVIINGGKIHRNVYGGGSLSSIGGPKIPPISTDPIRRDTTATATQGMQSMNEVTITGGQIGDKSSFNEAGNHVYGGYVFGASRGDDTLSEPGSFATSSWTAVNIKPNKTAPATKSPVIYADVYGGGEVGSVRQGADVRLTGGVIKHDAYGGGRGTEKVEANVGGKTLVKLNEGVGEDDKGCVVSRLFGGNNVNGTPGDTTRVYVYATQNENKADLKTKNAKHEGIEAEDATTTTYDVKAVYGGGNLSPYVPAGEKDRTEVYIQGCDLTSIKQVYGGANSASAPATMVTVNSAYEIQDLFGGGDGQGSVYGANVGYKAYDASYDPPASSKEERTQKFGYGTGVASLNIYGGRIHRVFGGSNTKGNVRETAITMLDNQDPCPLEIDEVYGGGKSAPMDAEAILHMACIPGLKVAYGGAQEADVLNNVELNVTNGTYDRIFGGNNISGTIRGSITVNIEETGCKPLIIGELYGGGNLAAYSKYGYKKNTETGKWEAIESANDPAALKGNAVYADPVINVKSFTSIGNIYGGGLGAPATVVGNPTVNISVTEGKYKDLTQDDKVSTDLDYKDYDENGYKGKVKTIDGHEVILPSHAKGKIGAIQNVFGGGNEAKVIGNTNVNVGTLSTVKLETLEDDPATADVDESVQNVVGADIRGDVYGGGNNAEVTGKTNVVIGKKN